MVQTSLVLPRIEPDAAWTRSWTDVNALVRDAKAAAAWAFNGAQHVPSTAKLVHLERGDAPHEEVA